MDRMDMNELCDQLMTQAPARSGFCDSDLNIMRGLAHEADEPCDECGEMVSPQPVSPMREDWLWKDEDGNPLCEECYYALRETEELNREARLRR